MTELIQEAYRRARRTGATVYAWPTAYRRVLADRAPSDAGSCGGQYLTVEPTGAVERYTYDPTVPNGAGYGVWRHTGTATVDASGSVIVKE